LKYGRHNYRVAGVRASVYHDAVWRHLAAWWEGQDVDPDSGLSHVTKAIASLVVLRDAMLNRKWVDDRPPSSLDPDWVAQLNSLAAEMLARYPEPKPAHVRGSLADDEDEYDRVFAYGGPAEPYSRPPAAAPPTGPERREPKTRKRT